jgi:hypothetical protein
MKIAALVATLVTLSIGISADAMAKSRGSSHASSHSSSSSHPNHADDAPVVYGTEDLLMSLCNSVTRVLTVATHRPYSLFRHGAAHQQNLPQTRHWLLCAV